jgi:hypothetical protein
MRSGILVGLLSALFSAWGCLSTASPASTAALNAPAVVTDRNKRLPRPAPPALPPRGVIFHDPTFGTPLMRLTSEVDGDGSGDNNHNSYSTWPTFNADSTRLLAKAGGGAYFYEFNPTAMTVNFATRQPLPAGPTGQSLRFASAFWSRQPNQIIVTDKQQVFIYDVAQRSFPAQGADGWRARKDLRCPAAQPNGQHCLRPGEEFERMTISADNDEIVAGSLQQVGADPNEPQEATFSGFLVWRRSTDTVLVNRWPAKGPAWLMGRKVQIDTSGKYLVVNHAGGEIKVPEKRTFMIDLAECGTQPACPRHYPRQGDPGHADVGNGMIAGWTDTVFKDTLPQNSVRKWNLTNPALPDTLLLALRNYTQEAHYSLRARDQNWLLISLVQEACNAALKPCDPLGDELFLLKTDGSQQVKRFLHHQSVYQGYDDAPKANLSPDGRFAAFVSNWGGRTAFINGSRQTIRDLFIAKVPQ